MCILHLGENGLEKYRLVKNWEQFKIVILFMDHPVLLRGDRIGEDRRINGLSLLFVNDKCHGKQSDVGDFLES